MPDRIGSKELVGCSGISFQREINPGDTVRRYKWLWLDGRSFIRMLLVRERKRIIHQRVEFIFSDGLVADMDPPVELRKIDIDPVGVFRFFFKKQRVLYNSAIHRILERIGKARLIKNLVALFRKLDLEIATGLCYIIGIA